MLRDLLSVVVLGAVVWGVWQMGTLRRTLADAVDTPMQRAGFTSATQAFVDSTPLGRQAAPAEVASVAVFLSSDHASFITGAIMNVTGGAWMG